MSAEYIVRDFTEADAPACAGRLQRPTATLPRTLLSYRRNARQLNLLLLRRILCCVSQPGLNGFRH